MNNKMIFKGKIWKYGDNIDTDVIIPARYLQSFDSKILAQHCLEDLDKNFAKNVKAGDILVAGENFGCGSSREHAPLSIKGTGVSCIVAKSYARIFFRNAINIGLPIFIAPEFVDASSNNNIVEVDGIKGEIKNINKNKSYNTSPLPEFLQNIIKSGGLINYLNTQK